MTKGRTAATVVVVAAALLLATGCSNGSDKSAGNVDTSAKVSITDATSTEASSTGSSLSSSGDSSSTASSSTSGGSPTIGEGLPDGFPSDLAPAKGAKDVHGINTTRNGQRTIGVSYGVDDDVKAAYERVKAQAKSAGYQLRVDEVTSAGDNSIGTLQGTKGGSTISVLVGADVQGSGSKTMVTMTIDG